MFGIENYLGFVMAAILLNITPGADSMYIITRSMSQGQTAGFYSVLGITSGILVHTLLAAFGQLFTSQLTTCLYAGKIYWSKLLMLSRL